MSNPEQTESVKYCLIQSESCDWYIVPYSKKQEAEEYLEVTYSEEEWPPQPEWLRAIDGPHRLVFSQWEIP